MNQTIDDRETAWLAGLLDGEGCFYFKQSTRRHTTWFLDTWVQVIMTHQPTVDRAARLMGTLSGDPCRCRPRTQRKDPRGYNRKDQWAVATSSKEGALNLIDGVLPFLFTKRNEALLIRDFLQRSVQVGKYQATLRDHRLVTAVQLLKEGCGEVPAEVKALLDEITPSQAVLGQYVSTEGVTTRE